ncbi:ATP-dependent helicase HrpB [Klebsiella pneumoniae]|uniref:ATP-dependent helicase HrpB n=1 Tax=Klebsiella pneumoniae TaxID=573 RepID=A0A2X3ERR5_KLEPN|nr:ATP-dependent helicase HrpB [Klebsiella pneumoniae]
MAGLLASAFADRIARRRGQEGRYQLANGMGAMLDADDALGRHEWLIAPLLLQGSASPDAPHAVGSASGNRRADRRPP